MSRLDLLARRIACRAGVLGLRPFLPPLPEIEHDGGRDDRDARHRRLVADVALGEPGHDTVRGSQSERAATS
jgi:hypothetical protein